MVSEISSYCESYWKGELTRGNQQATKERLLTRVADILEEVGRSGHYQVSPDWFSLDLTMPQVRVIFLLRQKGPNRMTDLASTLVISFSRATALVDQLVEKELVERWTDPQDRRSVLCALTDKGKELAQRLLMERRSRWEERLAPLSVDELQRVQEAMELVCDALQRADPGAEPATTASK
ncbi:MAG: MarR family transcriptional regulator [Dehalococcoidia bacterium]|nr:MarR family transcriptional regulator [Dehalococcoidia bacterium]